MIPAAVIDDLALTDWRGTAIEVGDRVIYHQLNRNHIWRTGAVTGITQSNRVYVDWDATSSETDKGVNMRRSVDPTTLTVLPVW